MTKSMSKIEQTRLSTAFYGKKGQNYIDDAVDFIQSIAAQADPNFHVEAAVDRSSYGENLCKLFAKHAPDFYEAGRLRIFEVEGRNQSNASMAYHRFRKALSESSRLNSFDGRLKYLFMVDNDIYSNTYVAEMHKTLTTTNSPIVFANQNVISVANPSAGSQAVQSTRMRPGGIVVIDDILRVSPIAFCTVAFNLSSSYFHKGSADVLLKATEEQLDRSLMAELMAKGVHGCFSRAQMQYKDNGLYGPNGKDLEGELALHFHLTTGLTESKERTKFPTRSGRLIQVYHKIYVELDRIRTEEPVLFAQYKSICEQYSEQVKKEGKKLLWGERALPLSPEQIGQMGAEPAQIPDPYVFKGYNLNLG